MRLRLLKSSSKTNRQNIAVNSTLINPKIMTIKHYHRFALKFPNAGATAGFAAWLLVLVAMPVHAQLTQEQINNFKNVVGSRVETATILGGDYGVSGGAYTSVNNNSGNVDINISKFGGMGDIGAPQQLGTLDIGWQPQLQGSMGYLTATKHYNGGTMLDGDQNENKTFAIQFGGGARFWFNNNFSIAPTFMGMYGHTENSYTANSVFGKANQAQAQQLGLIDWNVNTWTIRPALDLQYQYTWHRTIFTLSSDPTYYYTQSFNSSSENVDVSGNSESWENKLDVDVPPRGGVVRPRIAHGRLL